MIKDTRLNNVYIRFFIKGKDIDPDEITQLLGITPAYKYKRGDLHGENNQIVRKQGLWSITSANKIESSDLQLHIEWLLTQLEPVRSPLNSIVSKPDIYAEISCIFNLFTIEWDDRLEPNLLERITALNIMFGISIYCLNNLENKLNEIS